MIDLKETLVVIVLIATFIITLAIGHDLGIQEGNRIAEFARKECRCCESKP